jgi:hypothetical protein
MISASPLPSLRLAFTSHSQDGNLAVRGFTPVRVVCANILAMAHGADVSRLLRVKHTRDVHENLGNIREVIEGVLRGQNRLGQLLV